MFFKQARPKINFQTCGLDLSLNIRPSILGLSKLLPIGLNPSGREGNKTGLLHPAKLIPLTDTNLSRFSFYTLIVIGYVIPNPAFDTRVGLKRVI